MDQQHGKPGSWAHLARAWAISISFVGSVLAGGFLGWLVDHFAGSSPIGILVGLGLGLVAGMVRFIREAGAAGKGQFGRGKPPSHP